MTNRVVTKALAGIEDLLLGSGTVVQARSSGNIPITKIDAAGLVYENSESLRTRFGKAVQVLTNIAALQILDTDTVAERFIYLLGYTTAGDGGGGLFWLDTTDTTTAEDLNIVFNPDNVANGRWKRVDTSAFMSPDRGDANYAIQPFDFGLHLFSTALSADRTVTLPTTGLFKGKTLSFFRTTSSSFSLLLGGVATLASPGITTIKYDGTIWVELIDGGIGGTTNSGDSLNGSFEVDSNNDGTPDNWVIAKTSIASSIAVSSASSSHGKYSLLFTSGGIGGGTATSDKFSVLGGSPLTIGFSIKSSGATVQNKIAILTYDASDILIATKVIYSEGVATPIAFTFYKATVSLAVNEVKAVIEITGVDPTGTTVTAGATTNIDGIYYNQEVSKLIEPAQMFYVNEAVVPNMTVVVSAGKLQIGATAVIKAIQTTGTIVAPVGNPRIDRIVLNSTTGVIAVVTGTPAGSPVAPVIPYGTITLAQVLLQISSTVITSSMITDERALYTVSRPPIYTGEVNAAGTTFNATNTDSEVVAKWTVSTPGTGQYLITHNLGKGNTVQVNCIGAYDDTAHVYLQTANNCTIRTVNGATLTNIKFFFSITTIM